MLFKDVEHWFVGLEPVFVGCEPVFVAHEQKNTLGIRKNKTEFVNKMCIGIEIIRTGKSASVNNYTNNVN